MSDPLLGTLRVLPLVLVGLWAVERWARDRGGPVVLSAGNAQQTSLLAIFLLIILGRHHLGVEVDSPGLDAVLAGGLLMLLVVRVAILVKALGTSFQAESSLRPSWPFFVLPLIVYIAILPWAATHRGPDGDEPYFLLITHSLVHDLDTELTNNYAEQHSLLFSTRILEPEWADPVRPDGRAYSRHSLVLPMVLAPAYAVAGKWGAMMTMALIAAWVGWLTLYLILRYWGADHGREGVAIWALLALTPPVLLYSHQIWVELPAALLVLLALHRIQDLKKKTGATRGQWIGLGLVLVLLPLLKLRFVLMSVPLLLLAWWRSGGSRKIVIWSGLALVITIGGILLFNLVVFDKPFKDHTLAQLLSIQGRSPLDYVQGLAGLLGDCAFGLLASNPLWLLLIPALALVVWRRSPALMDVLLCVVPYLAVVSPRREWYGAWAPPFRFGIVLLPLLAVILVPLLSRRRQSGAKALVTALGFLALVMTILWVIVPGWIYNLAVGTNHLIDHLSIRLAADVGRFFPSFVRLRTASWLVPLLVTPVVILLWWLPKRGSQRAPLWATSALMLGVASLPVAAAHISTGIVEFEDRQVAKRGGELYPGPWEPFRPRYRGGWKLATGESVSVPVVAGGERVSIEIEYQRRGRSADPGEIVVHAGSVQLGTWSLGDARGWQALVVESRDWPAGANLTVEARGGQIILDRARFTWN